MKRTADLPEPLEPKGDKGYFYIVELIPEHTPFRIKMGRTTNLRKRLSELRVTCPKAVLLHWWHCEKLDEQKAIDFIDSEILVFHLSGEVIDLPAIDGAIYSLLVCLEEFFDNRGGQGAGL